MVWKYQQLTLKIRSNHGASTADLLDHIKPAVRKIPLSSIQAPVIMDPLLSIKMLKNLCDQRN